MHKIGQNEPSWPMIRASNRFDEQQQNLSFTKSWPITDLTPIQKQDIVYVTSKNPSKVTEYAELCVYVSVTMKCVNGVTSEVTFLSEEEIHPITHYQTRRLASTGGWESGWNNKDVFVQGQHDNLQALIKAFGSRLDQASFFTRAKTPESIEAPIDIPRIKSRSKNEGMLTLISDQPISFINALNFAGDPQHKNYKAKGVIAHFPPQPNTWDSLFGNYSDKIDKPKVPNYAVMIANWQEISNLDVQDTASPSNNGKGIIVSIDEDSDDESSSMNLINAKSSSQKRAWQFEDDAAYESSSYTLSKRSRHSPESRSPLSSTTFSQASLQDHVEGYTTSIRSSVDQEFSGPVSDLFEDHLGDKEFGKLLSKGVFAEQESQKTASGESYFECIELD